MYRLALLAAFAFVVGCNPHEDKTHHDTHASTQTTAKGGHDHSGGHEHGAGDAPSLMVSSEPGEPQAGQPNKLKLMLHGKDGAMIKDFEVTHEMKVHLIVVRDALDQFVHLHPQVDGSGAMTVSYTFPTGGTYLLIADYKPAGKAPAISRATLKVGGDVPPAPVLSPNVPGKVKVGDVVANVEASNLKAGGEGRIAFALTDDSDKALTDLQPYMGAMGHLVVLSADGKEYVHAHPEDAKAAPGTVAFATHFMSPGLYKGWGQFLRGGNVMVVPFVLKVD